MSQKAPYKVIGHAGVLVDINGSIVATFVRKETAEYFAEVLNAYETSTGEIEKLLQQEELKTESL